MNNFPKNTIEFLLRTLHSAKKAIFAFLTEHLYFSSDNTHLEHLYLGTTLLAAFEIEKDADILKLADNNVLKIENNGVISSL